jgi:hydrogenase expression/formation protein HypE
MAEQLNLNGWTCPLPLRDYPAITLGHGGGGKLSAELLEHLFLPAFHPTDNPAVPGDAALLEIAGVRLAFSTDSFVVRPLFFPGGCIGELAVNGTVNDLAMMGATPLYLSAAFILEEGLSLDTLGSIATRMGVAAQVAGVTLVTGDTKVVERGHGDGLFINTTGIGLIPDGVQISPERASPGDVVLVSGTLGDHGMAIMSVREGLEFDTNIKSDCAPLNELVARMLNVTPNIHVLRDPTRGGAAATLNEIAHSAHVGITLEEAAIPVRPAVQAACEILGMDPLFVANEGKLIAIVPATSADAVLDAMRAHPLGREAVQIGRVIADHPGMLTMRTRFGATRVIDMPVGEQLPRIC